MAKSLQANIYYIRILVMRSWPLHTKNINGLRYYHKFAKPAYGLGNGYYFYGKETTICSCALAAGLMSIMSVLLHEFEPGLENTAVANLLAIHQYPSTNNRIK